MRGGNGKLPIPDVLLTISNPSPPLLSSDPRQPPQNTSTTNLLNPIHRVYCEGWGSFTGFCLGQRCERVPPCSPLSPPFNPWSLILNFVSAHGLWRGTIQTLPIWAGSWSTNRFSSGLIALLTWIDWRHPLSPPFLHHIHPLPIQLDISSLHLTSNPLLIYSKQLSCTLFTDIDHNLIVNSPIKSSHHVLPLLIPLSHPNRPNHPNHPNPSSIPTSPP